MFKCNYKIMKVKQMPTFILIMTTLLVLLSTDVLCWTTYRVSQFNKCPPSVSKFLTMFELSIEQCVEECTHRQSCEAVGYKRSFDGLCELYTNSSLSDVDDNRCIKISKSDMDGIVNICEHGKVYDKKLGCVRKECQPQSPLKNGKYLGNMNKIGSKKAILCNPGYREETDTTSVVCTTKGYWSYNGSCTMCPFSDSDWLHSTEPGNFSVMILTQNKTQSDAAAFCNESCARLVQIDQIWKIDYVADLLRANTDFSGEKFWVDGSNSVAEAGVWKFSDGTQVPMDKNFWHENAPNDNGAPICFRIFRHAGVYRFEDTDCQSTYWFICEQTRKT